MFKSHKASSPSNAEDTAASVARIDEVGQNAGNEDHKAGQQVDQGERDDPSSGLSRLKKRVDSPTGQQPLPVYAPTVARQMDRIKHFAAEASPENRQDQPRSTDEIDNTLTVGRNIHLEGRVGSCENLVIEGKVEAVAVSRVLNIAETGDFSGEIEVETAEISGRFDGKLIARKLLIIHSAGKVSGSIRYGALRIEEGGEIFGDIQVVDKSENVAGEPNLEDADRPVAHPPEKVEATSQELSAIPETTHMDVPPPMHAPITLSYSDGCLEWDDDLPL